MIKFSRKHFGGGDGGQGCWRFTGYFLSRWKECQDLDPGTIAKIYPNRNREPLWKSLRFMWMGENLQISRDRYPLPPNFMITEEKKITEKEHEDHRTSCKKI